MIRKRGIIATIITVSVLVSAIPLISSLFDVYNDPLKLDSPLVFNDEEESAARDEKQNIKEEIIDQVIEAPEEQSLYDYKVTLAQNEKKDLKLIQQDFTVTVVGKVTGTTSIALDFYSAQNVSQEKLKSASVKIIKNNKAIAQKNIKFVERNKKGYSHFTMTFNTRDKAKEIVQVNWGDGFEITYLIDFKLS